MVEVAPTELDIVNRALSYVGVDAITSLAGEDKSARLCNLHWPNQRDSLIRSFPWNCLRSRAILIKSGTAPLFGYNYKFPLPGNPYCLRPYAIQFDTDGGFIPLEHAGYSGSVDPDRAYAIEGRFLLTNYEGTIANTLGQIGINLLYIARPNNAIDYDPSLSEVLALKLAIALAYDLTGSASRVQQLEALLKVALHTARYVNGTEVTPEIIEQNLGA